MDVLQGKKTYISAAILFLVGALGYWFGLTSPAESAAIFAAALGLVGLGAKADRYGEITLEVLRRLKEAEKKATAVEVIQPPSANGADGK